VNFERRFWQQLSKTCTLGVTLKPAGGGFAAGRFVARRDCHLGKRAMPLSAKFQSRLTNKSSPV